MPMMLGSMRAGNPTSGDPALEVYFGRSQRPPFRPVLKRWRRRGSGMSRGVLRTALRSSSDDQKHYQYLQAREELMTLFLKTRADHRLDAIVHESVEYPR